MKPTAYARRWVTRQMYEKGRSFVLAAVLLKRHKGHSAVVLHLLCQGIEILLKALLLREDYEANKPKLKRISHNLVTAAAAVRKATGIRVYPPRLDQELLELSNYYRQHLLRYASTLDILVNFDAVNARGIFLRTVALLRQLERDGKFSNPAA